MTEQPPRPPKPKVDWQQVRTRPGGPGAQDDRLIEHAAFGSNPGALRMFAYTPSGFRAGGALVVVLHGCGQTGAAYATDVGWLALAERYGFAVLVPQQSRANNPNLCFNWFSPDDTRRDRGEAASVHQMIETMISEHAIDKTRVFITGLSAGGAMAGALLASYPEVFAAGSIIAGLPYGAANNVHEALSAMRKPRALTSAQWADLVRRDSNHSGSWPRLTIWHGDADAVVHPQNAEAFALQWAHLHGADAQHADTEMHPAYRMRRWRDAQGNVAIESFTLPGFAHGAPVHSGEGEGRWGNAGPFVLEAGVSSSFHAALSWGLLNHVHAEPAAKLDALSAPIVIASAGVLEPLVVERPKADANPPARGRIRRVIEDALRAAGLMK